MTSHRSFLPQPRLPGAWILQSVCCSLWDRKPCISRDIPLRLKEEFVLKEEKEEERRRKTDRVQTKVLVVWGRGRHFQIVFFLISPRGDKDSLYQFWLDPGCACPIFLENQAEKDLFLTTFFGRKYFFEKKVERTVNHWLSVIITQFGARVNDSASKPSIKDLRIFIHFKNNRESKSVGSRIQTTQFLDHMGFKSSIILKWGFLD